MLPLKGQHPQALAERGAFFEGYRLFAWYTKRIVSQEALDAYRKEFSAYRLCEDGLNIIRAIADVKPYYDFGVLRGQQFIPIQVPITAIYDEDGRRHVWGGVYYYTAGPGSERKAGDLVEIRGGGAGVKAARASGALTPGMALVDLGCSVCGIRASAVGELDAAKAGEAVRLAASLSSFFAFYESRCPAGALHDWGAGQTCRKCGLAGALKDAAARRAYYNKYKARFAAARLEALGPAAIAPSSATPRARGDDGRPERAREDQAAAAWKPDFTMIVRAAELAGVTPATLEAIGSAEGRDYADIVEGRGAPPPPSASSDPRIFTADAEVRLFISDYSTLRNAGRLATLPPGTAAILAAAGVPKHDFGALPRVLPEIGHEYHAQFAAIVRVRPPGDAYLFAIQSLCRLALDVAHLAGPPEWAGRLGLAFAKNELETILRGQKLFSKPGAFNWGIFEDADDEGGLGDEIGDVAEDILEEILAAAGEEAAYDPFSGENMDYDTSENEPNNEPA